MHVRNDGCRGPQRALALSPPHLRSRCFGCRTWRQPRSRRAAGRCRRRGSRICSGQRSKFAPPGTSRSWNSRLVAGVEVRRRRRRGRRGAAVSIYVAPSNEMLSSVRSCIGWLKAPAGPSKIIPCNATQVLRPNPFSNRGLTAAVGREAARLACGAGLRHARLLFRLARPPIRCALLLGRAHSAQDVSATTIGLCATYAVTGAEGGGHARPGHALLAVHAARGAVVALAAVQVAAAAVGRLQPGQRVERWR
jgi:hypothetical protein